MGPLLTGFLAQYVGAPLRFPYLVLLIALAAGSLGVLLSPETRQPSRPLPPYRPQRVSVPAGARRAYFATVAAGFLTLATLGLFTGLAGTFLSGTLHRGSPALTGAVVFVVLAIGVLVQLATRGWTARRNLGFGMTACVVGVALVAVATWLSTPSLLVFVLGGAFIGAGVGTILKGTLEAVAALSDKGRTAEAAAGLFLAIYSGMALPVAGLGVTLQFVNAQDALLGFGAVVTVALVLVGGILLPAGALPASPAPAAEKSCSLSSLSSVPSSRRAEVVDV